MTQLNNVTQIQQQQPASQKNVDNLNNSAINSTNRAPRIQIEDIEKKQNYKYVPVEFFELLGLVLSGPQKIVDYNTFRNKLLETRDRYFARITGQEATQVEKRKGLELYSTTVIVPPIQPEDKTDEKSLIYLLKLVGKIGEIKNLNRIDLLQKLQTRLNSDQAEWQKK